jgi:hypothetical protein
MSLVLQSAQLYVLTEGARKIYHGRHGAHGRRVGQGWSGLCVEEKNFLPLPEIELQPSKQQPIPIPTELSRLFDNHLYKFNGKNVSFTV